MQATDRKDICNTGIWQGTPIKNILDKMLK